MKKQSNTLNVQPHSEEAELAVLGSMLSSKEAVSKSIQWLKPEHFYKDAHNKIFSAMRILFDKAEPIDTLSVSEYLKKNNELEIVGGIYFLWRSIVLVLETTKKNAMYNFFASFIQLGLLLFACIIEGLLNYI